MTPLKRGGGGGADALERCSVMRRSRLKKSSLRGAAKF